MNKIELRSLIYNRFIKPTEKKSKNFIGIEIEMPVVNLSEREVDQELTQKVVEEFIQNFNFIPDKRDENGVIYSATLESNGDNISFDCSYNNIELSLGKDINLHTSYSKFRKYVEFLNKKLLEKNHILTGFGINPNYRLNNCRYIPSERYRMLEKYLANSEIWNYPDKKFHSYPTYGTFASASQVQLDVKKESLVETINIFSYLEPIKALLFNNSFLDSEPEFLCCRDFLWEKSTHGINHHNVGMFENEFKNIDEIVDYISKASLFNVERDGHYIHFKPIPIEEYFNSEIIVGEYFENGEFKTIEFIPQIEDINYLRTYKYEDLTFRGTIEFRSCCNQPFSSSMSVAAFHVGAMKNLKKIKEVIENDRILYNRDISLNDLRSLFLKKEIPDFINKKDLKKLVTNILEIVREGLIQREYGEEVYLDELFNRASNLVSPGYYISLKEPIEKYRIVKRFADFNEDDPLELK